MAYAWRAAGEPTEPVAELNRTFTDQADAEAWLAATYAELAEAGIEAVSLYEAGRLVYGPMSLSE